MKRLLFCLFCSCLSLIAKGQGYYGSDIDKMNYQRYQQHSQQNASGNTYTPKRSTNNYNNRSYSNSYNNNPTNTYNQNVIEKVIIGVYVYDNQLAVVRLRYYDGKITHYSTSKDMLGREQWQSMYPDTPHPTMSFTDGQLAKEYNYKVSVSGTIIYFNL